MNSEKPGSMDSSDSDSSREKKSGKPTTPKNHDRPPWHHPSSKTEASALKAMLGKGKKKEANIKKPDSKRDENE